jgi:spore coat polysaccharide biosynthesis protein SpsF
MKKRVGALIPIRLASERLPNKAIKEICGKPLVCHLLDRAFESKYLKKEDVIVCTTKDPSDDALVKIVTNYGARVFRGSTDDIIKRFYDAMVHYQFDYVIQIDGDDITSDTFYMDLTMEKLLSDKSFDIVTVKDLPLGIATKSFSFTGMQKVIEKYKTTKNDTGFIYFFTKSGFCNHFVLEPVSEKHIYNRIRLTLDYKEDFELFNQIFESLYKEGEVFLLEDIIQLVKEKPELAEINYFLEEEYWQRTADKAKLEFFSEDGELKKIKL